MPKVKQINHVAVVVEDMEKALAFWRDALGMELHELRDVPAEKSQVAFLPLPGSEVELVMPTSDDSGIAKYLAKHGPGMHHVCLEVDDIDGMIHLVQRFHNVNYINSAIQYWKEADSIIEPLVYIGENLHAEIAERTVHSLHFVCRRAGTLAGHRRSRSEGVTGLVHGAISLACTITSADGGQRFTHSPQRMQSSSSSSSADCSAPPTPAVSARTIELQSYGHTSTHSPHRMQSSGRSTTLSKQRRQRIPSRIARPSS